jgi:hypothetical protein
MTEPAFKTFGATTTTVRALMDHELSNVCVRQRFTSLRYTRE